MNKQSIDREEIFNPQKLLTKSENVFSLFQAEEDYPDELMKLLFEYYKVSSLTNLCNQDEERMLKFLDLALFDEHFNCLMSVVDALMLDGKEFPHDRFNDDDSVLFLWFKEVLKIYSEQKEINTEEPLQSIQIGDSSILISNFEFNK